MTSAHSGLALLLHSGVPVVRLEGEWNDTTGTQLLETVSRLARAGHNEIIVNLSRATRLPLLERNWRERMERLAASIRARYGHLDIVASVEQTEACVRRQAKSLVRWATSEEQAICRIKGIPVMTNGSIVTIHLDGSIPS
jgi:hypothetical protein